MIEWLPPKSDLKRPRYRSLMSCIEDKIENGTLKPGQRLPTHRELAYQLGVSIQTVSRAYSRLVEAGKIVGEVGRGSFVRPLAGAASLPFSAQRAKRGTLDLALLKPVSSDIHKDAMKAALTRIAKALPDELLFSFRASTIAKRHIPAIDQWLALCGVKRQEQTFIPTNGNTSAMTVALLSVAHSGDLIVAEKTGHHTLPSLCRSLGMRLKGLETDREGMLPTALNEACQAATIKAIYVMPRCSPTGNLMGEERRRALVAVARQHGVAIIENDSWGPLNGINIPSFSQLAPERCYYFTSLTKCIAPGMRVGFLVAPESAARTIQERHMLTNWMVTPLMLEIAAQMIATGTAEQLLKWQRTALQARRDIAWDVLHSFDVRTNGLMAWLPLPDIGSEARLVDLARNDDVLVAPGSTFSIGTLPSLPGVRISLGQKNPTDLRGGLQALARLASEMRPAVTPADTL
ncbi:PLP-dependent aminotransferase family protein [Lentibacter sp. XHP0401]|jgi:DNA-binding transcriptional MocR family regulator|uniref:MocR-like ectoine utilization transcription factor EhuR n=1 Tax=Lentibacter sp. XHP0401 TaxID=2984334 RepID=UPI0021E8F5BB|nr:PLP-dependent aminotransferase family protein [Lentibacter sp. XHP0401]